MSNVYELNVSREGIIKTLKDQFTDRFTFLQEALQNARRAGANIVDFLMDDANLVLDIIDDGNGIDDFESLLTLGESGWDMQTMVKDYPYGVGFASLLMAADAVQIRTQDKAAFFFTDDLLSFKPVVVNTMAYQAGTHIRLWLKTHYDPIFIGNVLQERVKGFELPVSFNGKSLERPAALNNPDRHYIGTPIGMVSLPIRHPTDMPDDADVRAFVQGLPVEFGGTFRKLYDSCILIHFAPHIRARMPDRDKLLDEADVRQQWNAVRRKLFAEQLRYIKAHVPMQRFANDYWRSCAKWCPELLTDVPVAPSMMMACEDITPRLPDWHWQHESALVSWDSNRSLPRKGSLMLTGCFDAYDNQLANLYALKKDLPVVEQALPVTHWAAKDAYDATELPITYRVIGEEKTLSYKGSWIWVDVLFCDAIELVGTTLKPDFPHSKSDSWQLYPDLPPLWRLFLDL